MSAETGLTPLLAEFQDKAEPLGVTVLRVATASAAAATLAEWAKSLGTHELAVAGPLIDGAPAIVGALQREGVSVSPPGSPDTVRDAPAGVTMATMAVAETGSVLLVERSLPDRTVSMLTLALAVVCPTRALVPSLDEAMDELRQVALTPGGAFATLLTGPSRTADIERVLTVGVQGPGKVMTLFVDDL